MLWYSLSASPKVAYLKDIKVISLIISEDANIYLKVCVSIDEPLDLLDSMNDENVDQIFPGAVEPIVEWSSTFRKLQVQDIDFLEYPLGVVEGLATPLSQSSQSVPLVADALAASINTDAVVVLQSATDRKIS